MVGFHSLVVRSISAKKRSACLFRRRLPPLEHDDEPETSENTAIDDRTPSSRCSRSDQFHRRPRHGTTGLQDHRASVGTSPPAAAGRRRKSTWLPAQDHSAFLISARCRRLAWTGRSEPAQVSSSPADRLGGLEDAGLTGGRDVEHRRTKSPWREGRRWSRARWPGRRPSRTRSRASACRRRIRSGSASRAGGARSTRLGGFGSCRGPKTLA